LRRWEDAPGPRKRAFFIARLAPGGLRNRGNPRGPCAGRQEPEKRIVNSGKPSIADRRLFLSGCPNRNGNGEWQTVTIVAEYWQSMQRL